jgi:ribosomal protein S18 acetylase RimI-like enzyme
VHHVRRAARSDAPAISALAQEAHAVHAAALPEVFQPSDRVVLTPDEAATLLRDPAQLWWVAAAGRTAVGYLQGEVQRVAASRYKRDAARLHVIAMGVTAAARGQGVGRALLAAARTEATDRGLAEVTLEVYAFNTAARALYAGEGFAPVRELLRWTPSDAPARRPADAGPHVP